MASAAVSPPAGGQSEQQAPPPPPSNAGAPTGDTIPPGVVRHVLGRVVRPSGRAMAPVADEWVTLHRVGSDTAGPLDSTRTDAGGRFTFAFKARGSRDAVYFMSASYDGIAYLSPPLTRRDVRGAEAEITVYDTTSKPVALRVRGRHLVLAAPAANGFRSVVEIFELSNDTSVTLVAPSSSTDRPTWSMTLPAGAQRFQVGQGDVAADAVTHRGDAVAVYAPFAPGLKQMSFSYVLPPSAFPLARPLPTGAIVFEVLLEEPTASVDAPRLRELQPVAVEGRTFRRFLAQDVPPHAVATIRVPAVFADRRALYIAVVITVLGAAMLGALAVAFRRRPYGPGGAVRAA